MGKRAPGPPGELENLDLRDLRLLQEAERIEGLGSWEWNPATGALTWSRSLFELFDLDPDTRLDFARYTSLVHPDDRDRILRDLRELQEHGGTVALEHRIVRPDGDVRWLKVRAELVPAEDEDAASRVLGTTRDVTAEHTAEKRERALEEATAARDAAEVVAQRMRFLNEVSRILSSDLDEEALLEIVARIAVRSFADWCVVDVMRGDGTIRRAATIHRDEGRREAAGRLRQEFAPTRSSPEPDVRALRTGAPVFLPDVSESTLAEHTSRPEHEELFRRLGARSIIGVPLIAHNHVVGGMMFVRGEQGRKYGEEDLDLACDLANRVGRAVHEKWLYETAEQARTAAERRAEEEEALRRAAEALARTETVEEVTARIVESAVRATGADGAVVERLTGDGPELETVAGSGAYTLPVGVQIPFEGSLAQEVLRRGRPFALERLAGADHGVSEELKRACGECAAIAVPLSNADERLGALFLLRAEDQPRFEAHEVERARIFGELSAVALRKVQILESEEEARAAAEQRAEEEEALRRAAEALARTETVEEVTARIVESAVRATGADGAVVERLTGDGPELETVAGGGAYTLPVGVQIPFEGSLAQEVLRRGRPFALERLAGADHGVSEELKRACGECAAIAVPLSSADERLGALFLLRAEDQPRFEAHEVERARIFGELSAVALRKAQLLYREEKRSEELSRVMDSRSRLMQAFSHDVKNPLGAAESHARLLLEGIQGALTDDQRDSARRIVSSIGAALELIGDILELSRAEAGKIQIQPSQVELQKLVADVVQEHRAAADAADLDLSFSAPDQAIRARTDPGRVHQILANLLSNAFKFTDSGSVTVTLEERSNGPGSGSGAWAVLAVRDTGPGVPEAEQEQLFEEFSRIGRSDVPGSGLGLAISRKIARLLGGDITVESEPGQGSTFELWLPTVE